ncbi:TetR/AcrR family transcriptional regulator [Nocardia sp. CDC153]|uniref:TetR/AcrR family transcriptional regulator n=1 Tax=Nocardia sp. CDC153 TaxID=3112167 RepID=UPI002DBA0DB9|nr:TetR/AcrR family transcriptional regulator [Nocardia sp. CDC153]MEC3953328.1 TetR/AcrR family transcriptional regulator [Nocardia sp. CDC153]
MVAARRSEKSAETEQALKHAARRLFAERGYLNTKITDITAAAGRAAGSFYNHFASKEELLQSLLKDLADESDTSADDPGHIADFTQPESVRYHVAAFWHFSRRNWPVLRAIQQAALVNDDFARIAAGFATEQREEVATHLDGFAPAGLRLPAPPDVSLALMFQSATGLLQAVEEGGLALTDDQAIDAITRFAYRGLTGRDLD